MAKAEPKGPRRAGPWRLVFLGSGDFAVPSLEALSKGPDELSLVVASPPRPKGRGRKQAHMPTALFAREAGLPLLESARPNDPEVLDFIASLKPDLLVVTAFGAILKEGLLSLCPLPPINVHPSLLPRHRGPAPVNWALVEGDTEIGVSIMFLEAGMDTGPVLARKPMKVLPGDGAARLSEELAEEGAGLLLETIRQVKEGSHKAVPQDDSKATVNRLLRKSDGYLDFREDAATLARKINGLEPWPAARAMLGGKAVSFFGALAMEGSLPPGEVGGLDQDGMLRIGTGSGLLRVSYLQPEGKGRQEAGAFLRGYRPRLFLPMG
ncbi:MAG: methionyl-tRNA formyltransferase [Deltaproteobacteria bacterium]|jgi:methionyl-tRNA formyltransferase|nr:methionyl-tRNA formyltransferase [Deltaproteobacteria bacterium]